jgi:Domain of unknown function (DUF397)
MKEVTFRRSSFCTDAHGCVEVSIADDRVRIRDSKDPEGAKLTFDRAEWSAFVEGVKAGEFTP